MKRHKRDTGGLGKYIPHLTQVPKLNSRSYQRCPHPCPPQPVCPQQPRPRAQDYGDSQRRRSLGWGLGSFPLVACALSWGRLWDGQAVASALGRPGLRNMIV